MWGGESLRYHSWQLTLRQERIRFMCSTFQIRGWAFLCIHWWPLPECVCVYLHKRHRDENVFLKNMPQMFMIIMHMIIIMYTWFADRKITHININNHVLMFKTKSLWQNWCHFDIFFISTTWLIRKHVLMCHFKRALAPKKKCFFPRTLPPTQVTNTLWGWTSQTI